jgi:hypothetical protein
LLALTSTSNNNNTATVCNPYSNALLSVREFYKANITKTSSRQPQRFATLLTMEPDYTPFEYHGIASILSAPNIMLLTTDILAPFNSIERLFNELSTNSSLADQLNGTHASHDPHDHIYKIITLEKEQMRTIDLTPSALKRMPKNVQAQLVPHGFRDIIKFFNRVLNLYYPQILLSLSASTAVDFGTLHKDKTVNFRLVDHTNQPTDEQSTNNDCSGSMGPHTFSIIFQDEHCGLEVEAPGNPGLWFLVPGNSVMVLGGWSSYILTGGIVPIVRQRERRVPGVRRLGVVLFMDPDLNVELKPVVPVPAQTVRFSQEVLEGRVNLGRLKEIQTRTWSHGEGSSELQDDEIEKLVQG